MATRRKPSWVRHRGVGVRVAGVTLFAAALSGACFDSDQKFKVAETTTGGETTSTTSTSTSTGTTEVGSTTEMGDVTCRDAIDCVSACIATVAMSNLPEPDLSCLLECTQDMTEQEALRLLRLINCISGVCEEEGFCSSGGSTGTTGDTGGSSTGGSTGTTGTTGTTTSGGGVDSGLLDPCTDCIATRLLDPQPAGCLDFAAECQ